MTCANVLVGLGKIVKGWRLAMLDGRMEVRLSASLPRRERLHHHQPVLREPCISIHAPAKGATACKRSLSLCAAAFQSTLPRRERLCTFAFAYFSFRFQSTLPRRERHPKRTRRSSCRTFQSTLPRRERRVQFRILAGDYKFQSTLPRRERRCPSRPPSSGRYFNPRSREGSDAA